MQRHCTQLIARLPAEHVIEDVKSPVPLRAGFRRPFTDVEDKAILSWAAERKAAGQKALQWRNAEALTICPGRSALSMRDRYKALGKKFRKGGPDAIPALAGHPARQHQDLFADEGDAQEEGEEPAKPALTSAELMRAMIVRLSQATGVQQAQVVEAIKKAGGDEDHARRMLMPHKGAFAGKMSSAFDAVI
jgi:hypothetical protein